jgi:hemoglobin
MQKLSRIFRSPLLLVAALIIMAWSVAPAAAQQKTLYSRLGGYDAIAAVSDDFIGRLAADKQLSRFLVGLSVDSQKRLRQHLVDFLCNVTGGPCLYLGRDMKTSHQGLGISEKDWQAGVDDLVATLDHLKVPKPEKDEVIAAVAGLKKDIVEKP